MIKIKHFRFCAFIISLFLLACTQSYDQHYSTHKDFNNASQRNKSWFPDIISKDAYSFKNIYYQDFLCAFGKFSYINNKFYDSIFTNPEIKKIDFLQFADKIKENLQLKPNWFLNIDHVATKEIETINIERFYILRQKNEKKIYFIYTN